MQRTRDRGRADMGSETQGIQQVLVIFWEFWRAFLGDSLCTDSGLRHESARDHSELGETIDRMRSATYTPSMRGTL